MGRRNNISGEHLPSSEPFAVGEMRMEWGCSDRNTFNVDFREGGLGTSFGDGTEWGSDGGAGMCGAWLVSAPAIASFEMWVRE